MATSTALTEDRAEVLVQYIRGTRAGTPAYPPGFSKDAKRALRQQAEVFEERDGVLFHKLVDSAAGTTSLQHVLVTQEEKMRVLAACHSGVDGCHYGRDKTMSKVRLHDDPASTTHHLHCTSFTA